MYNIKISGIYATALTLFFIEHGFKVTRAGPNTKSWAISENYEVSADIDIIDRWNLQGITANGEPDAFNKLLEVILEDFPGVVIHHSLAGSGSVYKAQVKKTNRVRGYSLVDLGSSMGVLVNDSHPEGSEIIVEVKEPDYGGRKARVTNNVTVSSRYAVLIQGQGVKISRRIVDETRRNHLIKIGNDLNPEGFTILWRTAAENAPDDFLATDVHQLTQKANRIFKRVNDVSSPTLLWEGRKSADFEFPAYIKHKLDKWRRQVTPTVPDHHILKSTGSPFTLGVDLAEKLMRSSENKEIPKILIQLIEPYYPLVGQSLVIEHVKLNGHIVKLGPARLIDANKEKTVFNIRRKIRGRGVYDGFNAKRVFGDYVLSQLRLEDWYTTSHFYSQDHDLKGIYININTPVERYPWGLHYIDLGVDVVQRPDGEVEIIDLDELDEAADELYLTKWLKDKALSIAEKHKNQLIKSPLPQPANASPEGILAENQK